MELSTNSISTNEADDSILSSSTATIEANPTDSATTAALENIAGDRANLEMHLNVWLQALKLEQDFKLELSEEFLSAGVGVPAYLDDIPYQRLFEILSSEGRIAWNTEVRSEQLLTHTPLLDFCKKEKETMLAKLSPLIDAVLALFTDRQRLRRKLISNDGCNPAFTNKKRKFISTDTLKIPIPAEALSTISKLENQAAEQDRTHAVLISGMQMQALDDAIKTIQLECFSPAVKTCILALRSSWIRRNLGSNVYGSTVRVVDIPRRSEIHLNIVDVAVQTICLQVQTALQITMWNQLQQEYDKDEEWLRRIQRSQESRDTTDTALAQLGPDPAIFSPVLDALGSQLTTIVENQARLLAREAQVQNPLLNELPPLLSAEGGGNASSV
jgi:hypothetical protein